MACKTPLLPGKLALPVDLEEEGDWNCFCVSPPLYVMLGSAVFFVTSRVFGLFFCWLNT